MTVDPGQQAEAAPGAHAEADEESEPEARFPVDVPGFRGSLEELVRRARQGDVDLSSIPVAEITSAYRASLAGRGLPEAREVADFLSLASRLVSLKAAQLLPDGPLGALEEEAEAEEGPAEDPGARLAEYRLFRAAAEALLSDAEQGVRSFLGLVSAEVVPAERLAIDPQRLAIAFRSILERLPQTVDLALETVTYSVEEKVAELIELLRVRRRVEFTEIFTRVVSRLEAVACFLALLELVKAGEARVDQRSSFDPIVIIATQRAGTAATSAAPDASSSERGHGA